MSRLAAELATEAGEVRTPRTLQIPLCGLWSKLDVAKSNRFVAPRWLDWSRAVLGALCVVSILTMNLVWLLDSDTVFKAVLLRLTFRIRSRSLLEIAWQALPLLSSAFSAMVIRLVRVSSTAFRVNCRA